MNPFLFALSKSKLLPNPLLTHCYLDAPEPRLTSQPLVYTMQLAFTIFSADNAIGYRLDKVSRVRPKKGRKDLVEISNECLLCNGNKYPLYLCIVTQPYK